MSEVKLIQAKPAPGGFDFQFEVPDGMDETEANKQMNQLIKDHCQTMSMREPVAKEDSE